jgi:hypothetical protein
MGRVPITYKAAGALAALARTVEDKLLDYADRRFPIEDTPDGPSDWTRCRCGTPKPHDYDRCDDCWRTDLPEPLRADADDWTCARCGAHNADAYPWCVECREADR